MKLPRLNEIAVTRDMIDVFRGYDHNMRIGDAEFYDMRNMTSDHYPILAPRASRGIYVEGIEAQGIIAKDKLCYVDGSAFVNGDERIEMGLSTAAEDCPKMLTSMGAYVIIMPDKKYINTINTDDRGDIEAVFSSTEEVKFELCTLAGAAYENVKVSAVAPSEPENGQMWIDTSSMPQVLKKYSSTSGLWSSISTTYVKISSAGIGKNFSKYDGVKISGIVIESVSSLNGSTVIWECSDDYIVVTGIIDSIATQTFSAGAVEVARRMPNMDFIVESNNRIWGCRYGTNLDGEVVNEIYASKLGDFKNFNCFMNLSTDSYAASCGTDGQFTGAVTHLGYPIFFKETCLHKVYGNFPSNFQIQATACRGVQRGSHRSLAIVGETLFYKSVSGICAYDGSLPAECSLALGDERYSDAVAGAHGNKYYISMKGSDGQYHLFVYDVARSMWHKEDNLHADGFSSFMGELYCIDNETHSILSMLGTVGKPEREKVSWLAETGIIGVSAPDHKYVSRISLRMSLEVGTTVFVSIQYNSMGAFEQIGQITSTTLDSFSMPIRPRRCDHFRIRIEGEGDGRVYSITKTMEKGSEET